MNDIDRAMFIRNSREAWQKRLAPRTWASAQTVFEMFKTEMLLDPYQLLYEARRTQNPDSILNALSRFYDRCINRGLSPASAREYVILMRSFYKANRVRLPRSPKQHVPIVSLSVLPLEAGTLN